MAMFRSCFGSDWPEPLFFLLNFTPLFINILLGFSPICCLYWPLCFPPSSLFSMKDISHKDYKHQIQLNKTKTGNLWISTWSYWQQNQIQIPAIKVKHTCKLSSKMRAWKQPLGGEQLGHVPAEGGELQ